MTLQTFFKKIFSKIVLLNCLGMIVLTVVLGYVAVEFVSCYTQPGDSVKVPNVRGQKIEVVEKKLEALGLRVEVTDTGYIDTYVGGVVLDQFIAPGKMVKPGRVIKLVINASSARAIAVPSLADNCSRREAEARLRAIGFKNIRVEFTPGDKDWLYNIKVGDQPLKPGAKVPVTALITLVVGDGMTEDTVDIDFIDDFDTSDEFIEEEVIEDGGGLPDNYPTTNEPTPQ